MNNPKENLEMMKEMNNNGYESVRELGDINLRIMNNMMEKQSDMLNTWLDASAKQMELSSTAKDPKEFMASQAALTKEMGEKLIAEGREVISTATQVQGEYRAWYEKSVQSMTNNLNKASQ